MFLHIFSHKLMSVFIHFLLFDYFTKAIITPPSSPSFVPESERFVVMTRHGQTEWTRDKIFCGWYDSPLTQKGRSDAIKCAQLFKDPKYTFHIAFTSVLSRAEESLAIMLDTIEQSDVIVKQSWRLNERHYGALTGQKKENVEKNMVDIWRRSYDVFPPVMENNHPCYHAIHSNQKIVDSLNADQAKFPTTETLKTTMERVSPYWEEVIKPVIQKGNKVLIVAHGTVLKALIKIIENLTPQQICDYELPTAAPFVYEFDEKMNVKNGKVFLGDQKELQKRMEENRQIKSCPINE